MGRSFPVGSLVADRFVIEQVVARGGMGTVLRAHDKETGRMVALKLLLRAADAARFAREARLLSLLHHPSIVAYTAHGFTADAEPYLAMEWLEGQDLAQLLRQRSLLLSESLQLLRGAAVALNVAHHHGIVHRDVKPSKVAGPLSRWRRDDAGGLRTACGQLADSLIWILG